jgi:hypothetical protein
LENDPAIKGHFVENYTPLAQGLEKVFVMWLTSFTLLMGQGATEVFRVEFVEQPA